MRTGHIEGDLTRNPAYAAKLDAELSHVLGNGPLTSEGLHRLPLLTAAIREAGRLQSPVLLLAIRSSERPLRKCQRRSRMARVPRSNQRVPACFMRCWTKCLAGLRPRLSQLAADAAGTMRRTATRGIMIASTF